VLWRGLPPGRHPNKCSFQVHRVVENMRTFNIPEAAPASIIIPLAPKGCSWSPERDLSFLLA